VCKRSIKAIVAVVFALFPLAVFAQPIRVSYVGTTGTNVPLWVTREAGLLKKHGLSTDLILISGGSTTIQALLAHEIAFATISGPAVIQARLQGADVVIIASPYNLMPYSLVVHETIRSPADLKGKRVAITRFGGITEVAARLAFDKLGLSTKEVTMIQGGPDAQRLAAVQSRAVAGTLIGPPVLFSAISQGGLKVMLDLAELGGQYPMGTIVTSRSYQAQNQLLTKRFLMAFVEGLRRFVDNKDFSLKVMQKYTRLSDQEVLSKSYDYFAKRTALVPFTDPVVLKNVVPPDRTTGRSLEDFYDNSVIQELVNEGFLTKEAKYKK
jgi:ABC-type nitrate/sulfonate/bicarbonate transport system substrate-binding protein